MCRANEYKKLEELEEESEVAIAEWATRKFDHILNNPNSAGSRKWEHEFSEDGKTFFARIYVGYGWCKELHEDVPRFARFSTITYSKKGKETNFDLEILKKAVEHFENNIINRRKNTVNFNQNFFKKLKDFFE